MTCKNLDWPGDNEIASYDIVEGSMKPHSMNFDQDYNFYKDFYKDEKKKKKKKDYPLQHLIDITFRICHTYMKISCICVVSETNRIRIYNC